MIKTNLMFVITFAMLALSLFCRAQGQEPNADALLNDSVIEIARANMQADKATVVASAMDLNDKDAAAFWPIYRQYENERSELADSRVAVIKEYSKKYPNLTDAEAKSMAERMFEYDARLAKLKKKYFKKFNKELPALTITKFFQVERRIDLLIDMNIEASLPPLTQAKYFGKAQ